MLLDFAPGAKSVRLVMLKDINSSNMPRIRIILPVSVVAELDGTTGPLLAKDAIINGCRM